MMRKWRFSDSLLAIITAAFVLLQTVPSQAVLTTSCDVNGDSKIGLAEAVNALRIVAGLVASQPLTQEQLTYKTVANFSTLALADDNQDLQSLESMDAVLAAIGLTTTEISGSTAVQIATDIYDLATAFANCGSVQMDGTSAVEFSFDNQSICGIGGTVRIAPSYNESTINLNMQYQNVTVPVSNDSQEVCTINGTADTTVVSNGATITMTHTFTNMSVCGQSLTGTITVVYYVSGQLASIAWTSNNSYDINGETAAISTDLTYTTSAGIAGTVDIVYDGETYALILTNVTIDPVCGLPNSGTMTVNTVTFDFSNTSCDNPVVDVTIGPITVTLGLEEAAALILDMI